MLAFGSTAAEAASIVSLGALPGESENATAAAISADGSTVVGEAWSSEGGSLVQLPFVWTRSEGLRVIPGLPEDTFSGGAFAVSADGSFAAGYLSLGDGDLGNERDTFVADLRPGGEATRFSELPGGFPASTEGAAATLQAISDDGSTLAGTIRSGSFPDIIGEAFVWNAATGITPLGALPGALPGESPESYAAAISADGRTIVGQSGGIPTREAFIWNAQDGMRGLGFLPDGSSGSIQSVAVAVSGDGSVVAGNAIASRGEAFIWTEEDGMRGLGDLAGGPFNSSATAISADGTTIVGSSLAANPLFPQTVGSKAFIWDADHGMRALDEVLEELGVDLTGWTLQRATGVSADGKTILGRGIKDLRQASFVAVIPEPSTALLLGLGLLLASARPAPTPR